MTTASARLVCELRIPNAQHLYGQIRANARFATRLAVADSRVGRRVLICGAGPSLAEERDRLPAVDELWACNSALPYLYDAGVPVTHGFCVDQGDAMLARGEWGRALPVEYLVASCVHPRLVRRLREAGRRLTFFHSYLGQPDPPGWVPTRPGESYEWHLYTTLFRPTVQVGYGLNSVQRAVCLALFLGFTEILVAGADCAAAPDAPPIPCTATDPRYDDWLRAVRVYADGRSAYDAFGSGTLLVDGEIDGRRWVTRGDMVISARMMVDMVQMAPDRIRLLGDTLPAAILPHADDPEWMDRLPRLGEPGQVDNLELRLPAEAA